MTWGAIAAAGGTVIGGLISAAGSQGASSTQAQGATDAASIAANAQLQGLQFVQQQEAPYNLAGQQALAQYEQLLGLTPGRGPGGAATIQPGTGGMGPVAIGGVAARPGQTALGGPAGIPQAGSTAGVVGGVPGGVTGAGAANFDLTKIPGYAFELQQGQQALENSAASRGQALSGNTIQGELQFGQGLASTQFQQYMQQLAGLTNLGQAAASGVANQGAQLLSGAGASLASGVNNAAGYNAANITNLANIGQSVFNAPSVQSGLKSLFSQPAIPGDSGGGPG
jgi:hypothetical protein